MGRRHISPPWNPSMPPLLVIQSILFIFISCLRPVLSENVTVASSVCPVPLSPLLQQLLTGINQYPTCSLSSRPADPAPEFLSFEEWKAKQLAEQDASNREKESHSASIAPPTQSQDPQSSNEIARKSRRRNVTDQDTNLGENIVPSTSEKQPDAGAASSPRSHIPLIDRFNYASNECNARIHSSHKTAKSASSILSRKKDRYMLSPCHTSKESQFVIVELCEDIRIDTIQLANFEFFSGVFKDFRVSVAHAYTSDGKGWVVVGDYTAKNIRGVQSFHPSKELLPFYRYIRVDFLSYYGKEHFCPVSLLRVYGLTQMEEWKSDVWKAEWEASQTTAEPISSPEPTVIILEGRPVSSISQESAPVMNTTEVLSGVVSDSSSAIIEDHQAPNEAETHPPEPIVTPTTIPEISFSGITSPPTNDTPERTREIPPPQITTTHAPDQSGVSTESASRSDDMAEEIVPAAEAEFIRSPQSTEIDQSTTTAVDSQAQITSLKIPTATTTTTTVTSPSVPSPSISTLHASAVSSDITQQHTITQTLSTTIILSAATPSASPPVPNGESVYRMIMNRLTILEGNQTLYARYVEEQGRMVNVRLERMEEDIGRLGGIVTLQQQYVAKMLESHRADVESEHGKLVSQVEHLAHEVLMEKRLGVAQLLLLITVLVFMGLTRGSRGEPIRLSRASAAWHKGIQNSGEWVSGWRGTKESGADEAASVMMHENTSSPALPLRPPYARRSSSTRLDSIERRPRRTSSQRAGPQETNYDELFQTLPRLSRNPTRSRQSSQHSRSRNHTLTRPPLPRPDGSQGLGITKTLAVLNTNVAGAGSGSGAMHQKGHKRTNSGGASGYWRAGRSVSLTSTKTTGTGLSFGKSVGPTRRLAKTAHMHEVKPLRSGSTGTVTDSNSGPERRRTMADELSTSQSLSVLSPMMEDPHSAGMVGFGDAVLLGTSSGPVRIGGFDAEISTAQSEGVLSDPFGSSFVATSSSGLDASSALSSGLGIPFPSPALDYEGEGEGEDDVWVDEGGDEESFLGERSALGLGLQSSSPTRVKRGSGFSLGSPRKFVLASSPPGKAKVKRRSDVGASAVPTTRLDSQLGDGKPTASSTRGG